MVCIYTMMLGANVIELHISCVTIDCAERNIAWLAISMMNDA
jgi:hypothetical protein